MKIEIVTTKKKLTKAIVNQMRRPSLETMKNGDVLGYMIGIVRNAPRAFLIHNNGEYFVLESNWKKGKVSVYRSVGTTRSQTKQFGSPERCDEWWSAFEVICKKVEDKPQIYI